MNDQELWEEAKDAFYQWEQDTKQSDLSDHDRVMWCVGYIKAKLTK